MPQSFSDTNNPHPEKRISAIILSAGYSSRMKEFKPLLEISGKPLIEHTYNTFIRAGITDIVIVTGNRSDFLINSMGHLNARWAENIHFHEGMYTSVRTGVMALKGCDAFFLIPVDIPFIRPSTLDRIIASPAADSNIIIPTFSGIDGHPPLVSSSLIKGIIDYDGQAGLAGFFKSYGHIKRIPTGDEAVLMDCDYPEDFEKMKFTFSDKKSLTETECMELLRDVYMVDNNIIEHSQKVSSLALFFAGLLNMDEPCLNLIRASGLLHDIARTGPQHDRAGYEILMDMGYPEIAEVILQHMDIRLNPLNENIDASQLIYLADKLIEHTEIVDLKQRFESKIKKFGADTDAGAAVKRRLDSAITISSRIERICGSDLGTILNNYSG